MDVFDRLAPFIQDFIYQNKWEELRGIQVAACEAIFDSDDNLLYRQAQPRAKPKQPSYRCSLNSTTTRQNQSG